MAFLLNNRYISPFKGYDRDYYTQYDVDHISHFFIDQKGYERLRELQGTDSNVGFVAMWFNPQMLTVYEQSIQPALEYIEEGAVEPRFRAVRVDNVEHVNDINDEIIAQIRRSRFMVCPTSLKAASLSMLTSPVSVSTSTSARWAAKE